MQGKGMIVQVKDDMMGYYGHKRRYGKGVGDRPKGDIFRVKGPHKQLKKDKKGNPVKDGNGKAVYIDATDFSDRWMIEIEGARLRTATRDVEVVEAEEKAAEEAQAEQSEEITEDDLVIEKTEPETEPEIKLEAEPEVAVKPAKKKAVKQKKKK